MDPAGNRPLSRFEVGLLGLLLGLLAARHLCLYHQGVVMAHLAPVADSLAKISAGEIWVSGPRLWVFDLPLTSPLYYWLHLPLLLFRNPIIGIHLTYFFYEALALSFWVLWGLRGGLDRRLVWLSAGCLALYWDQGALVAHNMVPASALAIPLFAAFICALPRGTARGMVLPGVFLGLTIQVHPVAALLLPAMLLGLAWGPGGARRRQVAGLLLGGVGAYIIVIIGLLQADPRQVDSVIRSLATWDPSRLPAHMDSVPVDLLALAGLALVAWRFLSRQKVAAPWGFAALWLLLGLTALVLATGYLRPRVDMDYRFSLLKPARAMLSASFLVWFADSARAVLTRVRPATPARLLTLLGWTACLAVALLVKVPQAPPCAREVATGRLTPETLCAREDLPNLTSVGNGLVRGINSSLAGDVNSGGFFFWGVWADQLNVLLWLMEAGSNRGRQGSPLSACMARLPVLALPGRDGTDLTYLAADHRVKFHQLKTRNRFALSIPPGPRQLRDLVVRARTGDPAKLKLTLRQGARKIPPSGSWSPCGVEPAALFALFKLEPGGGELQIEVQGEDYSLDGFFAK